MDHIAIMKREWGLTDKILSGKKTIESRWYVSKRSPWNRIKKGDVVYFKDSGASINIKTEVKKVLQFSDLTPKTVNNLLRKYGDKDGIEHVKIKYFYNLFKMKKYCILVFLKNPRKTKPFNISKKGFGSMSAWISIDDINKIRID